MPELPLVGDEFAGYRLRAVLGKGGMSTVYQAENPRLGNVIALKVLAPELASDDVFRTRFLEESRIAAAMNHPHVIPIHDMGSSDGLLYIAMRCVSGTDLRQMISKRGRLLPDTAVFLLSQAARALDAAHRRGLVHRDVKPGNLLVERGNDDSGSDPDHLYLADFGITKPAIGRSGLTSSGQFLGTIDYVAPEQIRGLSVLGMADQYSLGCVLYECLTGRVPFEKDLDAAIIWAHVEETPTRATLLRPDLPAAVDEVFDQVLAKQPGDRYASCREFMTAARGALRVPETAVTSRPSADLSLRAPRPAPEPAPTPTPTPGLPDYQELAHDPGLAGRGLITTSARRGAPPALSLLSAPTDTDAVPLDDAPPPLDEAGFRGGAGYPGADPDDLRGWSPPRRRRRNQEGLRVPLLVLAAAIVIAAGAGIGIAISLSRGGTPAAGPSMPMRAAGSTSAAAASPKPASPTLAAPKPMATGLPASTLVSALEPVQNFTGRLSLAACKEPSATEVTCTNPDPKGAIASASFQTFTTLGALYTAYQTDVAAMAGKSFRTVVNTQNCGYAAPQPMGEVSWNHSDQHTLKYSVAQMASGTVPTDIAAGRMFCIQLAGGGENIIWTENYGHLLVVAKGAVSHEQVWLWFVAVHHNVAFKGAPAMPGM
jgi:serine/threonine protein kinase